MATSTSCVSNVYDSLRYCQGKTVLPGIRNHVFALPASDIVTWPTLPETGEQSAIASYAGDFELKSDVKWKRIDLVANKGQIEYEVQGEKPGCTFLNKITVIHPGNSASALGFARKAVQDNLVFLVPQRDGSYRVLGNKYFETEVKPKGSTGESITDSNTSDLEIQVTDICPAPYYPGVIETEDGDIDGKTGEPVPASS